MYIPGWSAVNVVLSAFAVIKHKLLDVPQGQDGRVLNPKFHEFVQEVVTNGSIPGLTLGVIHAGGDVEFGAWGKKTEDGQNMTADVSTTPCS